MLKISPINAFSDNYIWLIQTNEGNTLVDPGDSEPIISTIDKLGITIDDILITHHHFDHIGGNKELKKKYNLKVIGFEKDKERIPEIDITLKDKEIWKSNKFETKIYHIPGHTSGHICYHFFNQNILFTGDTLFSLGCGRIFEGSYEQMYNSLQVLKNLDKDTKIYCGHEYTLKNSEFCLAQDSNNNELLNKIKEIKEKIKQGKTSMPSTIGEELNCNIFLKSNDLENFKKLRDLKDNF